MHTENKRAELPALLEAMVALAHAAGEQILEVYNRDDFSVESKQDNSPLTAADLASHNEIVAGLEQQTPDIPILSEESAALPYSDRSTWSRYWLVDPLDGTREFIKRNGEFTVNIALIEDGVAVLGVVYVPVTGVCYSACVGHGAFKQSADDAQTPIRVRRLGDDPVMVVGSRSHRGDSLNSFLERLGEHDMVGMGSSLKLCLVAEGAADIYPRLGPTSEWDTAAAQCVVEQAGGFVTSVDMQPLRYNTKDSLLNPFFLVFGDNSRDWSQYLEG
ncbi:MAG: 3'(2'),5'-bisphosphate nucleotidase CysQ [Gammaproteobacteria bacterium]|nr:3'(2'),5'-bisphosphate nucleotidase CysQ [Gammaproteobacteria bacterium]